MFSKVLVANRGEIAVRVIRTLRAMGISQAAVFTKPDRASPHVRLAQEAYQVESYLSAERLIQAARRCGADAIHPGYGFLSENADFAKACEEARIAFVGPPSAAIAAMGRKTEARRLAVEAGVPVTPGTARPVESEAEAIEAAERIGFPVMLKAAAGGGGKGMRRAGSREELSLAFREASGEAQSAFADGAVYLEKLIERPRHIEVQIFGDGAGNLVHLGERECSLQRRHQKVIEECPSPFVEARPGLRERIGQAAVKAARAAGYRNAGTVEFLVDEDANFYFLEMNTRLQVEHPVTEMVTGLDLVELQIRVAAGERLPFGQDEISRRGWAMECRVYAEDPERGFMPSPGKIGRWAPPAGPGVRIDSGVYPGWTVPIDYDPMLAKLAAWGATREQARARLAAAIDEFEVTGIRTNLAFFREILDDPEFRAGALHTGFIGEYFARRAAPAGDPAREELRMLVAKQARRSIAPDRNGSRWLDRGRASQLR